MFRVFKYVNMPDVRCGEIAGGCDITDTDKSIRLRLFGYSTMNPSYLLRILLRDTRDTRAWHK